MNKFYRRLKVFITLCSCFLFVILVPIIVINFNNERYAEVFVCVLGLCFYSFISAFLIVIYRNRVIDVECSTHNIKIITNCESYDLNPKYFTEVCVNNFDARTYIKYDDGKYKKKFVFQMKYSPFKTYMLDIENMKKFMQYTNFK